MVIASRSDRWAVAHTATAARSGMTRSSMRAAHGGGDRVEQHVGVGELPAGGRRGAQRRRGRGEGDDAQRAEQDRDEVEAVPVAAPANQNDPPEPIQLRPGASRLHIELTRPADLKLYEVTGEFSGFNYRGFSTGTTSRPVCIPPCDQVVDGSQGNSFFFNGDGVVKSRDFSLSDYGGDVVARVKPGRSGLRVGGIVVMSLGGVGLAGGAFLLLTAKNGIRQEYDDMNRPLPLAQPNYVRATALLISGALVVAGGLAMLLLSRTQVRFSQRTAAARRRLGLA